MNIETNQPGKVEWCKACGAEYVEKHACGPFVVRETYGGDPDGKTYYVAVHEPTGFAFTGRSSRGEASSDARIGNSVLRIACDDSTDEDRSRSLAWGSVANTLSRLVPEWHGLASTGERSAVVAIEKLVAQARQVQALKDALAMCIRPMERAGLVACADRCRAVLFGPLAEASRRLDLD